MYLNFSEALEILKGGGWVTREGWNGKGTWLCLVDDGGEIIIVDDEGITQTYEVLPWIGMKTADDKFVPWLANQTDILAKDWIEV